MQLAAGVLRSEDKFIIPNYQCPIFEKTYRDLYKRDSRTPALEGLNPEDLESVSELPSPLARIETPSNRPP